MNNLPLPSVSISNVAIRQDADGRYCLNDLHQAAGGEKRHQPSDWLRIDQTKALIDELRKPLNLAVPGIPGTAGNKHLEPVVTIQGGNAIQGTFVVKELVYAYGMWISPAFCLLVIRTFDQAAGRPLDALNAKSAPLPAPAFDPARVAAEIEASMVTQILRVWSVFWDTQPLYMRDVVNAAIKDTRLWMPIIGLVNKGSSEAMASRLAGKLRRWIGRPVGGLRIECLPLPAYGRRRELWIVLPAGAPAIQGALPAPIPVSPAPALPSPERITREVRAAINRKAHALSAAAFEHNVEILEDWLRREGDLSDPAAAIERINALELDHGKHVMLDLQLIHDVTSCARSVSRAADVALKAISRMEDATGRQLYN